MPAATRPDFEEPVWEAGWAGPGAPVVGQELPAEVVLAEGYCLRESAGGPAPDAEQERGEQGGDSRPRGSHRRASQV